MAQNGEEANRGFSLALQMDQIHLKISPKNEKTDRKTDRRRIKKWWSWWESNP